MPKFTFIVPVYNVAKYLHKSLDSIKKQSFKDFEVICVDDCSTDNSLSVLNGYARDSRFKIIALDENKGVSNARNVALDNAKGDYIVFVDPDDWIELSLLKRVNEIVEETNCTAIWFNHYLYDEETHKIEKCYKLQRENNVEYIGVIPERMKQIVGTIWDKVYSRKAIEDIHLRFSEGLITEDDEFTFKFFSKYMYLFRLNTPLYYYRKNRKNSYCDSHKLKIGNDAFEILLKIYDYCKAENIFSDYKVFILAWLAYRIRDIRNHHNVELYKKALSVIDKINYPADYT